MELRKCCNHPFLVHGVMDGERDRLVDDGRLAPDNVTWPLVDDVVSYSGKMVLLDKLLPKLKADGHKVLIFSQFKMMLDLVEEFLVARRVSAGVSCSACIAFSSRFALVPLALLSLAVRV